MLAFPNILISEAVPKCSSFPCRSTTSPSQKQGKLKDKPRNLSPFVLSGEICALRKESQRTPLQATPCSSPFDTRTKQAVCGETILTVMATNDSCDKLRMTLHEDSQLLFAMISTNDHKGNSVVG